MGLNFSSWVKKHGIDFCCGGGISLEKACDKHQVKTDELIEELANSDSSLRSYNYKDWDLSFLAQHIEYVHHSYVEESIPIIKQYAEKVAKVHGNANPELHQIRDLFTEVANELTQHLKKEELILFPFISKNGKGFKNE